MVGFFCLIWEEKRSTQQYCQHKNSVQVILYCLLMPTALTNCTVQAAYTTETPEGCSLWEFNKQLLSTEGRQSEGSARGLSCACLSGDA